MACFEQCHTTFVYRFWYPSPTPPLNKLACSHANHKLFTASDFYFLLLFQLIMVWTLYGGLRLKWMSLTLLWHIFGLLSMMKTCLVNLTSLAMQYFQCAVWRLVSEPANNVFLFSRLLVCITNDQKGIFLKSKWCDQLFQKRIFIGGTKAVFTKKRPHLSQD